MRAWTSVIYVWRPKAFLIDSFFRVLWRISTVQSWDCYRLLCGCLSFGNCTGAWRLLRTRLFKNWIIQFSKSQRFQSQKQSDDTMTGRLESTSGRARACSSGEAALFHFLFNQRTLHRDGFRSDAGWRDFESCQRRVKLPIIGTKTPFAFLCITKIYTRYSWFYRCKATHSLSVLQDNSLLFVCAKAAELLPGVGYWKGQLRDAMSFAKTT